MRGLRAFVSVSVSSGVGVWKAIIVGGGIGGLTTALMLQARGIDCELFEQSDQIRELGVGINTLPHAIRSLRSSACCDRLDASRSAPTSCIYCNRHGQEIWREPRGIDAGFDYPQFSIHRGRLQSVIYAAPSSSALASRASIPGSGSAPSPRTRPASPPISSTAPARTYQHRTGRYPGRRRRHSFLRARAAFPERGAAALHRHRAVARRARLAGVPDRPLHGVAGGLAAKLVLYPIAEGSREDRCLTNWAVMVKVERRQCGTPRQRGLVAAGQARGTDAACRSGSRCRYCRRPGPDRGDAGILEYPLCDRDPAAAAGRMAASPCSATPHTRCIRLAPMAPRRRSSMHAASPTACAIASIPATRSMAYEQERLPMTHADRDARTAAGDRKA